ncbi:hypothetical protein [Shewanella sp. W3-18-1]|uniref:hypothetical protein n=1 Tax=Shewanella sp. (strain W3-18-1) TaxID=351745 RepID=UPI00059E51F7|nr:hypothetical protein [Shewanella sp. W3-18-1]
MSWFIENKEWLLSGAAISIPIAVIGWIKACKSTKQLQKSGHNSVNIQVGGNLKVGKKSGD